ncbi:6-phosphogluconolactonase-like [Watersipora subatra]|uniref:6-phosphogluconolactonase-like n=1 Tax=Watersipora subatra TaxID=2589382 RepID=UPI00355BFF34
MSHCKPKVTVRENGEEVCTDLCTYIANCATEAVANHGAFFIGLSGGSLANTLAKGLPLIETDWSKWRVFFCDERHVPFDNADSTYRVYKEGLFAKVPLSDKHVFKIKPDITVEAAALDYAKQMKDAFGEDCDWPIFDLLLLGMGPDGHTCSLFPTHPLLEEETVWVAPINDSPKPPPSRITMTFPVINRAKHSAFAACGDSKASMVQRVLEGDEKPPLPAAMVQSCEVCWFLDKAAASLLTAKL